FNIVIMRGFFQGIDPGIIESARIDGASEWRILFQMVLPMSKAVVAVVALFYAVGYWNAVFNAVLAITDAGTPHLPAGLRGLALQGVSVPGQVDVGSGQIATLAVQMAVMVIALVPVVIVYPFI